MDPNVPSGAVEVWDRVIARVDRQGGITPAVKASTIGESARAAGRRGTFCGAEGNPGAAAASPMGTSRCMEEAAASGTGREVAEGLFRAAATSPMGSSGRAAGIDVGSSGRNVTGGRSGVAASPMGSSGRMAGADDGRSGREVAKGCSKPSATSPMRTSRRGAEEAIDAAASGPVAHLPPGLNKSFSPLRGGRDVTADSGWAVVGGRRALSWR